MFSSCCASFVQGCVIGHHYNWICGWQGTWLCSDWGCTCSWCILCSLDQPGSNCNNPNTYSCGKFTLKYCRLHSVSLKKLYTDTSISPSSTILFRNLGGSEGTRSPALARCWSPLVINTVDDWSCHSPQASTYLTFFWRYLTKYSLGN